MRDLPSGRRLVSVVVPALNESGNMSGLVERMRSFAVAHPEHEFELVLVDDGSSDGTAGRLLSSVREELRVTVVQLSRTFGSHAAITAGLRQCSGNCAVVLGADAQEPLQLVADFLAHWGNGSDVVWGVRRTRSRRWHAELPSKLFSWAFTRYADLANYPAEGPSGMLLDRSVIDELNLLGEHNRNIMALVAWLGYTQTRVAYDQLPRTQGRSSWTVRKMVKLAADSLLAFSSMPLRAASYAGVVSALVGLAYAAVLVVRSLLGVSTPSGWPTILVVVLLLGGLQLVVIGVMGEYVWRVADEVRRRPLYVVKQVERSHETAKEHR
ncbi:glycosyltransferase family 2 protein [Pedococcus soli]